MLATDPPTAFFITGPAGTGKSTVSRELAYTTGAVLLDKDAVCGAIVEVALEALGVDPNHREGSDLYRERVMPAEYRALFSGAADNLQLGLPVVIDAPFSMYLAQRHFYSQSTSRAGWPAVRGVVVRLSAPEELVRERLTERGLERDHVKLADWKGYWGKLGAPQLRWPEVEAIDVSVTDGVSAESVVGRILSKLKNS
jgi:predicted kinase